MTGEQEGEPLPTQPQTGGPDESLTSRVIQRVFAAAMLLNAAADGSTPATVAAIEQAIGELNRVLRDISGTAFHALVDAQQAAERRGVSADLAAAAECLDVVASAITRLVDLQVADGACTVDLVEAAHSALRARIAVEEARVGQLQLVPRPDRAG